MVKKHSRESGILTTELVVAMGILVIAVMPLAYGFASENKLARSSYQRAAAMEVIDGEMEILMAGEWHDFQEGAQPYPLRANLAKSLPPGKAILTVSGKHLRLEWSPDKNFFHGKITREADAP